MQVFKDNAEGFTDIWEYTSSVQKSLFVKGNNVIQVLTEDHGSLTYFDMKLEGDVRNVPEPATLTSIFLGFVLIGGFLLLKRNSAV